MSVLSRFSWNQVKAAVNNIYKCNSYYAGATLCIDMAQGYTVLLCRNGRGSVFVVGEGNAPTFLMPKDIQAKVNELYQEIKQ